MAPEPARIMIERAHRAFGDKASVRVRIAGSDTWFLVDEIDFAPQSGGGVIAAILETDGSGVWFPAENLLAIRIGADD